MYTELGLRQEAGAPQLVLMEGTPACPTVLAQVKFHTVSLLDTETEFLRRKGWMTPAGALCLNNSRS